MSWSRNVHHLTYTYDPIEDGSITQGPNCHKCMNRLFHDKKLINIALFRICTSIGIVSFTPSSLMFSNSSDSPFTMKNIPEDIVVLKCVSCARLPLRRKYPENDDDIVDVTPSSIAPKRVKQDDFNLLNDGAPMAVLSCNCGLQVSESKGERRICESMEQGEVECHVPFVRISKAEEGLGSQGDPTTVTRTSDKDATHATHINATNKKSRVPVAEESSENSISQSSHTENADEHNDVSSTLTEKQSLTETNNLPNNSYLSAKSTSHSSIEREEQSFASKLACSSSIQPSNLNLGKDTGCKPPRIAIPDSSVAATVICKQQLSLNVTSPNKGQKVGAEENHDAAPEVVTENRTEWKRKTAKASSTDNSFLMEQALDICNTTFTFPFMYGRRPNDADLVPKSDALRIILPFIKPLILQKLAVNYFAAPRKFFCRYCDHHFGYSSGHMLVQHILSIPHLAAVYKAGYAFSFSEDVAKLTTICKKLQIKVTDTNLPRMVLKDTQTIKKCDDPSVSTANTPIVSLEERSSVIQLSYGNNHIPDRHHSANFIEQDKVKKHPAADSFATCEAPSKKEKLSTRRNSTKCDMFPMSKPPGNCDPPAKDRPHSSNFIKQDKVKKHPAADSFATCEAPSKKEELSTRRNSTKRDMSPMSKPPGNCDPPAKDRHHSANFIEQDKVKKHPAADSFATCEAPSKSEELSTRRNSTKRDMSPMSKPPGNCDPPAKDRHHSANFIEQDKVKKHPAADSFATCEAPSKKEELSTRRNSTKRDMSPMGKAPGNCNPPARSILESIEAAMDFSGKFSLNSSKPTAVSLSNWKHTEAETSSVGHVFPYMLMPDRPYCNWESSQLISLNAPFVQPNVTCSTLAGNQWIDLPFMFGRSRHEVDDPMSIDDKTHTITHFKKFAKKDIVSVLSENHYFGGQKTIGCITCRKTFHSEYASNLIRHFTTRGHWNNVLQSNRVFSFSKDYQKLLVMYNDKCTGKQMPFRPPNVPFVNKISHKKGRIPFEKLFNCLAWLRRSKLLDKRFVNYMLCIYPHLKNLRKCHLCKHKVFCHRNSNDYLNHFLSNKHIAKAVENGWNLGPHYKRFRVLVLSYLKGNNRLAEAADMTKQMKCAVDKKQFSIGCAVYKHLFNEVP